MGNVRSSDQPVEDPYKTYPQTLYLPATWQYKLEYDKSKIANYYNTLKKTLAGRIEAMVDNEYKSNFSNIYRETVELEAMEYGDVRYADALERNRMYKDNINRWTATRDQMRSVTVWCDHTDWLEGVPTGIKTQRFAPYSIRIYTTQRPEGEEWLMKLAAYMGEVHTGKEYPDDGPSKEALKLLAEAREIRKEYDNNRNGEYYNNPSNRRAIVSRAKPLYYDIVHYLAIGNPDIYGSVSSQAALKEASDLIYVIIQELDDNKDKLTDEELLRLQRFPWLENLWVSISNKYQLPSKLMGAMKVIRDFKLFSMDNMGIVLSFIINAFLGKVTSAAISAGINFAYKQYYKARGNGPLGDLAINLLLPKAASDDKFVESVRLGHTILSDIDYGALLFIQASLVGIPSLIGNLGGYGGAKLISESWGVVKSIPLLGWLLDYIGEGVESKFNDMSIHGATSPSYL